MTFKSFKGIDYIFIRLEQIGDEQGINIDTIPDYSESCRIMAECEFDHIEPTPEQKRFIAETAKSMAQGMGVKWENLLHKAIEMVLNDA